MTERIPEDRVVRYWLERDTDGEDDVDPETLSSADAIDALLATKPGAASFVWRERPIEWYRLTLDRETFADLRPVGGPESLLWRELSTDGTLLGVAERIHSAGVDALSDETGVDLDAILEYHDDVAAGRSLDPPIVRTRRGATPWFVVDGNHRLTAVGLHYLETERYEPRTAYVAVTENPVLGPAVERIRGAIQRLRGRTVGRDER